MTYLCSPMKKTLFILMLFVATMSLFGQTGRVTGIVRDAESGETLIGVAVYEPKLKVGVTTNEKGKYEISLPEGNHQLQFSYVGFDTYTTSVTVGQKPKTMNVKLQPVMTKLKEVEITGQKSDRNVSEMAMSVQRLDMITIKKIPALMGRSRRSSALKG